MTNTATATAARSPRVGLAMNRTPHYVLDASHSHVSFAVRHLMISNVRGEFQSVTGDVRYDANNPEVTVLDISIDVASINTREEKRDAHLRSADFFDVEKHPAMTFVSKQVSARGDGGLDVVGDLTIRGVTREVTLAVDEITPESTDPWGNLRIGASAKTKIRRSDFGMTWNSTLEAGGVLVGDDITISIEAELIKQK